MERLAFLEWKDLAFRVYCSLWEKLELECVARGAPAYTTHHQETPCVLRPHHPTSPLMHAINKQIEGKNLLRNAIDA